MNKENQKMDAFNKIKLVVDKHNLDISNEEINDCVEDLSEMKTISFLLSRCSAEENLQIINQQMDTEFTLNTPLCDILDKISEKWDSL